jgi:hypothetical protein
MQTCLHIRLHSPTLPHMPHPFPLFRSQIYEYYDSSSGTMYVATPPAGLSLSSLLAQVLSRALGSPFTLPLHPLLEVPDAAQLPLLQPVLHPGGFAGYAGIRNVVCVALYCMAYEGSTCGLHATCADIAFIAAPVAHSCRWIR